MTSFVKLFQRLQSELGEAALPLNPEAQLPQRLILSQALYPDLARDAATLIFKHIGFDKNYIGYFSLNKFQNSFSCLELFRDNHDNHFSDIH